MSKIPKFIKIEKVNKSLENAKGKCSLIITSENQVKIKEKKLIEPSNQQKIHVHQSNSYN